MSDRVGRRDLELWSLMVSDHEHNWGLVFGSMVSHGPGLLEIILKTESWFYED